MARSLKFILPVAFLALASLISFVLVQSRPAAMLQAPQPPALLVSTLVAERESVTFRVESQGSVTPRTETTLVSEVAGQIIEVSPAFVAGGFFRAGDVLLRIDPRNYETKVKVARAEVAKARTQVATENALADYALNDWQRLREFSEDAKAASDLTLRKPQLAAALAELESADAALDKARRDLARTVIRAPYHGMVRSKRADIGQYVSTATAIADTFAIDYAEIRLPLRQRDLRFLDLPDAIAPERAPDVRLSALIGDDQQHWSAKLVRSEGVFDAQSRVLYAVAQIQDPYRLNTDQPGEPLRIGTFVTAEITGRQAGDLFVLPRHALYRNNQVWIVDDESRIRPRTVEVLRADDDHVYVESGLNDGDIVCVSPIDQPLPGTPVRIGAAG
jgi:RND family efflux transporter MFP subunit